MTPQPEQLGLAGMPTRLFAATPSKLGSFDDCPRRYRFTYVDRPRPPKGPPWAHNSVGASAHNALRAWWDLPRRRRSSEAAGSLVDSGWLVEGFRDAEQSAQWRATVRQWVTSYAATLDPDDEPPGLERTVSTTTQRLAVQGRVDRVDERDGECVVVDYKTGRRPLDTDDARGSQALALYVLGVRRTLHRPCSRVELHHLPTGTVAGWDHTEESLGRHVRRAENTAADILLATEAQAAGADEDDAWPARPGMQCGFCDYRRNCAPGMAAGPARDPWFALTAVTPAVSE